MVDQLTPYNVVWDSPSKDASGSMPLGNGDVAANVWVEAATGDVLLLIGKSDAWDQNSVLLKLGRVRIRLNPNPLLGSGFKQTLNLAAAETGIAARGFAMRIWIDANEPVIRIECDSDSPVAVEAKLEVWRTQPYAIRTQTSDIFKNLQSRNGDPYPTIITPDQILSGGDRVVWCHHNEKPEIDGYEINMKLQGLGGFMDRIPHPLAGRTFGAAMFGQGFDLADSTTLRSAPSKRSELSIHALSTHPATVPQWQTQLFEQIASTKSDRAAHDKWWADFWDRSWIFIDAPETFELNRAYILQRFMNACAGRGPAPIKHNGSLFSVGNPDDPDFRRWGGPGFWFQNQRLIYWPMLAVGDFDLMLPWLRMYRDQLPLQKHRTQTYFGHGGAHYPETVMFWGAEVSAHYEWIPFEDRPTKEALCAYLRYYWTGGLELTLILLGYFLHTADLSIRDEYLLPMADAITEFFDLHWPRDASGKIHFEPAQSLETWHQAVNPLPEIAGLRYVLPLLLETLPDAPEAMRMRWERMLTELPAIPTGVKDGKPVILPAERFDRYKNAENPELYSVFPYRLFGLSKPDLELARNTLAARVNVSHTCWSQDEIHMALLGLTEQARQFLLRRASADCHSDSRFPAFWNAFHDWIPDIDHGGVLQFALQLMLLQCDGREIRLFPAWPDNWDVRFRLRARYETTIEGEYRAGRLVRLQVSPAARRADTIVPVEIASGGL